jgi:hypothetical protein
MIATPLSWRLHWSRFSLSSAIRWRISHANESHKIALAVNLTLNCQEAAATVNTILTVAAGTPTFRQWWQTVSSRRRSGGFDKGWRPVRLLADRAGFWPARMSPMRAAARVPLFKQGHGKVAFMQPEAALASAAGRGRGDGWPRRCWRGRPGAAG